MAWHQTLTGWLTSKNTAAFLCATGVLLAPAAGFTRAEAAADAAPESTNESEGSVLVQRRAEPLLADSEVEAADGELKPISQVSEYAPQPAGPQPVASLEESLDDDASRDSKAEELAEQPNSKSGDANTALSDSESQASKPHSPSIDVADVYVDDRPIRRATFRDVLPGDTTKNELIRLWGEPAARSTTESGEVLLYDVTPFARVDVLVEEDTVEIIRIKLSRQEQPQRLEKRLQADEVESVELVDEQSGALLGLSYPEKGLMLLLADAPATPSTPQFVTHIVIGRLDAQAFALRADNRADWEFENRLADLTRAIAVDPECGYAHYLAAEVYMATGQVDAALESAEIALETDSEDTVYRLQVARALFEKGDYDRSVLETRGVLDAVPDDGIVKAEALHMMGRLASLGDASISDKAIAFHTMAIAIADKLATKPDDKDRRAAKRLLVKSHLAIAKEVSRRNYDRKIEVVAQWIGRASGLAEEMIGNDAGSLELRLIVARDALEALGNLKPTKDPGPWLEEADQAAKALKAACDDPMMTARVDWLLGEAYYNALRVEHARGEADKAVLNGERAIDSLMAGAVTGDIRPSAEQLVGRLYFHLGAVNAVHKQDHEEAVAWYERAHPLLTSAVPDSRLYVPRRSGEALVSMAVSFWNQEQKVRAVELTIAGSELMEKAVQSGVLEEKALAVPYGNLSTMHRKLGDDDKAARFAKLARSARGSVATASRQDPGASNKDNKSSQRSAQSRGPSKRSAEKAQSGKTMVR